MRVSPPETFALTLVVAGCSPGVRVEVFNHSAAEATLTESFNDGSSATRPLPPGYPIGPAARCVTL